MKDNMRLVWDLILLRLCSANTRICSLMTGQGPQGGQSATRASDNAHHKSKGLLIKHAEWGSSSQAASDRLRSGCANYHLQFTSPSACTVDVHISQAVLCMIVTVRAHSIKNIDRPFPPPFTAKNPRILKNGREISYILCR